MLPPCFVVAILCAQWATAGSGKRHSENVGAVSALRVSLLKATPMGRESPNAGIEAPPARRATQLSITSGMGGHLFEFPAYVKAPSSTRGKLKAKESVNVTASSKPAETVPARRKNGSMASIPTNHFESSYGKRPGSETDFNAEDYEAELDVKELPGNHTRAVFTFCHVLLRMYHYRPSTNSCVSTLTDQARVCNQSPNRFATMEECRRVCLGDPQQRPEACEDGPIFSVCSGPDVKPNWTFFDGKRCKKWSFPRGLCPAPNNTQVFSSLRECIRHCMPPARNQHGSSRARCPSGTGHASTCPASLLRFPYFASYSYGKFDCFRGSIKLLEEHHCIVSPALFATKKDCDRTCVQVSAKPDICWQVHGRKD